MFIINLLILNTDKDVAFLFSELMECIILFYYNFLLIKFKFYKIRSVKI